jgi:hypothetical protein
MKMKDKRKKTTKYTDFSLGNIETTDKRCEMNKIIIKCFKTLKN